MNPLEPTLWAPAERNEILRGAASAWPRDGGDDDLSIAAAHARRLILEDRAQSTRDKYAACWGQFVKWMNSDARLAQHSELPALAGTVGLYIGALRARKLTKGTILVHLSAIAYAHEIAGYPPPWATSHEVGQEIRGLRRQDDGDANARLAIEREQADDILKDLPEPRTLTEIRDTAIFCLGWLTALRRSNLAALRRRDVNLRRDMIDGRRYLDVAVRRSKTDQEGRGRTIVVTELPSGQRLCAVRAIEAWLAIAQLEPDAPLFQSLTFTRNTNDRAPTGKPIDPSDVARIVKRLLKRAKVDPAQYAAHSLRRGFATSMQNAGIPDAIAMEHGGWKSKDTYYRYNRVDKARHNAVRDLFG